MVVAQFDPGPRVLTVQFSSPLAAGNLASGFRVFSDALDLQWGSGSAMSYTPGSSTFSSTLAAPTAFSGSGEDFDWPGTAGPIAFQGASSLPAIPLTPVSFI